MQNTVVVDMRSDERHEVVVGLDLDAVFFLARDLYLEDPADVNGVKIRQVAHVRHDRPRTVDRTDVERKIEPPLGHPAKR